MVLNYKLYTVISDRVELLSEEHLLLLLVQALAGICTLQLRLLLDRQHGFRNQVMMPSKVAV